MKKLFFIFLTLSLFSFGQTAEDYFNKGISKFNIKDYKGAISEFNKTIILNPNYADAYINRGIAKKKTLDYTGAITDYNKAIQLNPNNSDYFYNRGIAKYNLEDFTGAIYDFNKAIELDSDNSDAYTMKEDATKKLKGNLVGKNSSTKTKIIVGKFADWNIEEEVKAVEVKDYDVKSKRWTEPEIKIIKTVRFFMSWQNKKYENIIDLGSFRTTSKKELKEFAEIIMLYANMSNESNVSKESYIGSGSSGVYISVNDIRPKCIYITDQGNDSNSEYTYIEKSVALQLGNEILKNYSLLLED